MFQTLLLAASLASTPPDLTYQQLGPCHWWQAHTQAGEKFLKALPEKWRAPTLEAKGGVEAVTGRSEYDPKTKSVYASPSVLQRIKDSAEKERLGVEEYDPYQAAPPQAPTPPQAPPVQAVKPDPNDGETYEFFRQSIAAGQYGYLLIGNVERVKEYVHQFRIPSGSLGKDFPDGVYECYRDERTGRAMMRPHRKRTETAATPPVVVSSPTFEFQGGFQQVGNVVKYCTKNGCYYVPSK